MKQYKSIPILILLAFAILMSSCAFGADADDYTTLTILHTNDIHGSIEDLAKISAYIESTQASSDSFLYLDGGDIFTGHPVVDLQHGEPIIQLLNDLGLDAMAIGNHEFDYGQEQMAARVSDSNFPWLSANTIVTDDAIPIQQPEPYRIFEMGTFSVGVLGLTQAPPSTAPSGIEGLEFLHPLETIETYVDLRDEVDVLIALTHIGYGLDQEIAEEFEHFDVIIGGHSHTVLETLHVTNGTPIAQTGANAQYIGHLTIELDPETWEVQEVEGFLQPVEKLEEVDLEVQDHIDHYFAEMEEVLQIVVGRTETGLSRNGRYERDAPLGNFFTDAMRHVTGADIALYNNGGLREDIDPGEITAESIYSTEPFQNEIMEWSMTGEAIKNVLQQSYSRGNDIDFQTSGLHYTILTDRQGNYIDAELEINGDPLDLEASYTVAINDYMGAEDGSYDFQGEVIQPATGNVANSMIVYAEQLMEDQGSIDYESEGRIEIRVAESTIKKNIE